MTIELAGYEHLVSVISSLEKHEIAAKYLQSRAQTRAIVKGNQGGGTTISCLDCTERLLGIHPVADRNRLEKPIRFVSKVVPQGPDDESNQQYVEFKKLLPRELVKKDVTARSNLVVVRDPKGGSDRKVEFMGSTQEIDAFMSVQRSAYYQDEEIDRLKWDENQMRLLAVGGDSTICLTPVRGMDWTYDRIWRMAEVVYRSKRIHEAYKLPRIERRQGVKSGIEAFCWATDDNPVMKMETLQNIFEGIDDPDELAMRRYGVFRQVSGRIYKAFDRSVHVLPMERWFSAEQFRGFWHYRVIDYHPKKPWYVTWVAISPRNEWFVWNEMLSNADRDTTNIIRDKIKSESLMDEGHMFNRGTLIDPLSKVSQPNTGRTVYDDLATGEDGLRRLSPADTKNESGRMNIKQRLLNSLRVQTPVNNLHPDGVTDPRYGPYLPTLWFFDICKGHIEHFNSWRYVDWKQEHVKAVKEIKRESEKFSDYCRNLEFLGALAPVWYNFDESEGHRRDQGFFRGNALRRSA